MALPSRTFAWLGLIVSLLLPAVAGAQIAERRATARLEYSLGPGAQGCPDEADLRAAVARRLGQDPFQPSASRRLAITIRRRAHALVATLQLRGDGAELVWQEELDHDRCPALIEDIALAVAIELVPEPACPEAPPCPPTAPCPCLLTSPAPPPPSPPTSPAPRAAPPSPPAPARGPRLELGGGTFASLGLTPYPGLGGSASARLRWPAYSLGLEGRLLAPAGAKGERGTPLEVGALSALALPCLHHGLFAACGSVAAGALAATSTRIPGDERKSSPILVLAGAPGSG